jgi:hypothetical protein
VAKLLNDLKDNVSVVRIVSAGFPSIGFDPITKAIFGQIMQESNETLTEDFIKGVMIAELRLADERTTAMKDLKDENTVLKMRVAELTKKLYEASPFGPGFSGNGVYPNPFGQPDQSLFKFGQCQKPPFFTGQSSVNTESGQMPVSSNYPGYQARRDSLELSVAVLARRVQNLESIAPPMLIKSTGSQNSGVVPPRLLNSLEIEVSNYVYKLLGERDGRSFTVSELIDFMIRNNFSWTSHVPLDTFPARWLSEMLPSLAACSGIGFTFTLDVCYDKGVVKAGQQFSHTGTDLTEEDQTVVFIKELFAFKTEYKIFDIKELYDYMVSKNYTPPRYVHLDQVVRKLAPRLGLNYTPSTKSSDGTVSVYQPEVFKKLLAAAVRFAIVGPNGLVTNWRGLDLIDSLCKETGVPLQLVQDYYKCWISHGIIVINTNALYNDYRDANGQMIPNITFNMNRVEALMKI